VCIYDCILMSLCCMLLSDLICDCDVIADIVIVCQDQRGKSASNDLLDS